MGSSDQNASKTLRARDGGGERQRAAGQRFRQRDDIRHDAGCFAGEQGSGAAEAGEDFIEDQQQLVAVRRLAQPAQHRRVVKAHAARTLHQRLDDDAGELVGMALEKARKGRGALLVLRQIDHVMLGQEAAEQRVHARVRDRRPPSPRWCRRDSRPVKARNFFRVRTPWFSQNCTAIFIATSTATEPEFGEEDAVEVARHARREPAGQRERLLVGEPAEHDVRHQRELALDRLPDVGMVIAVAGRPPRCDAIDELASVGEHDAAALRADHRQRRARRLHLRIRQPDMGEPGLVPGGPLACSACRISCADIQRFHSTVHCRHSALAEPTEGRCEDAFTR